MNLNELRKSTVQSFIKGREQQAEIAAAHSQTAKKAYLGNSRETGWRDPIVPRVVGQIGKIGQHDDALLRTAAIFDKRSEQAKASALRAKLRLSGKKTKKENTMQNEEYTQVLEQMILSLTGMELEELHEAVVGQLSEDYQTPARNAQMQDMYDRAEGKFMNNISSDKLLRKVWAIDNKNNAEQQSPRLYGKNGKIIKQTKKKRVRVGQPGGKQGGYQG